MKKHKTSTAMMIISAGIFMVSPVLSSHSIPFHASGVAQAQGLDGFFKKVQKDLGLNKKKGKKRKGSNSDLGLTIMQGVGLGLVAGGIIKGNAGPLVLGSILVAAPALIKQDMERKYGRDQSWAGCVSCNQKRLLVRPGSTVTSARQAEIEARIKDDVRDIQGALAQLGYYNKKIDGDYGPGSRRAAALFQKSLLDEETGKLTAEQRSELFKQARVSGYEPKSEVAKASLMPVMASLPVASPANGSGATSEPRIKQYKLAESQVGQFATEFLQKGELGAVKDVRLLGDGRIEVAVENGPILRNTVDGIEISPHELSDRWVQVSMRDEAGGDAVLLNTVDIFNSAEEATKWQEDAHERMALLKKLTVVEKPAAASVIIADQGEQAAPQGQVVATKVADDSSGTTSVPADASQQVASGTPKAYSEAECGKDVYVSFNFPETDAPINHYNITPPEGTLMMDNGDETAYFTGSCVQGKYDYKYVVVTHDKAKNSWGSFERQGSFELASLSGQCEVNLNDPNGSATLLCY